MNKYNPCDVSDIKFVELPDIQNHSSNDLGVPDWLAQVNSQIDMYLLQGVSIRELVALRAKAMDTLLIALFNKYQLNSTNLSLFATGGYGRGELSLYSDVDILLISKSQFSDSEKDKVNRFVAKLWDIGIEPALAVRTVDECVEDAKEHTIATALLESRMLAGNQELCDVPRKLVDIAWKASDFYDAKMQEAKARYIQHNSTEYNLEPDIKNAPGGLRDIHAVGWVSKRYFRVTKQYDLVQQEFLTEKEFDELTNAENFLWKIRHYLHSITGRDENKLLFDYQHDVAEKMGYQHKEGAHKNYAVERFMRDYYRCAMKISTLSEMLTTHYYEMLIEARLPDDQKPKKEPINALFNKIGNQIAISHHKVFAQHPEAILQMFLLMGQLGIKRVRTRTLRALTIAAKKIDEQYRQEANHKRLFIENVKEQNYLYHRLRTMSRYGILGSFIPAFGQVTGLMQYDLFHRYTVDAHTLLLIRFLHRFVDSKYQHDFDLVSSIYQRIERKEILSLAAIFHDIAKGRGGDHSELGEVDAINFCLEHGLSEADAKLVGWLTRNHLLMSITAQKKDISDPEVVTQFADAVGNVTHLNHLYVLTVADMNATNAKLWNSWRATLMKQLYTTTRRVLRADIDAPMNRQQLIMDTRNKASQLLDATDNKHMNREEVMALWDELGDEYFLRELPKDILWHTEAILNHPPIGKASNIDSEPLVILREHRDLALDAVQIFIYTQDLENLFAVTTSVFDLMDLDVLDARIITGTRDFALDSYVVLDRHGTLLTDESRQQELTALLLKAFADPRKPKVIKRRLPRRLKHFDVPTRVKFSRNSSTNQHIMSLVTLDQPSILAQIGQVFLEVGIEIHSARISTLGERAEDMFYISDKKDKLLTDDKLEILRNKVIQVLDQY